MTNSSINGHHSNPIAPFKTKEVKGYHQFLPAQPYPIGSLLPSDKFPQNGNPPKLFEPLTIRGVTFANRIWVSPMCMYSSDNGHATDHHFVHLGSMAMRGWGNIMIEATAVVPEGRITEHDAIEPLKRIVKYVQGLGGKIGIQLAHAGRKASTIPPWTERIARDEGWTGGCVTSEANGGWPNGTYAPSEQSFHPGNYPDPIATSEQYIEDLKKAYLDAVDRCKQIGFDYIEIHGAHGYLIHEFLSPISNQRTDKYGGSLDNRLRLPLEITKSIREVWDKPLFFRVSASDWLEEVEGPEVDANGGYHWWGIQQTTVLAQRLKDLGVDLLDVSSGGNDLRGKIKIGPSYQLSFAEHIKKHVPGLLVGAVGLITESQQANDIIEDDKADVVLFARELLRNIDFPLKAAQDLGAAVSPAVQYERMVVKRDHVKAEAHHRGKDEVEGQEGKGGKESGRG